jgi:hypothetical protein
VALFIRFFRAKSTPDAGEIGGWKPVRPGTFADKIQGPVSSAALLACGVFIASAALLAAAHSTVSQPAPAAGRLVRTVRLAPNAPISIRATVGDVTVTGWDRPDVEVEIVRNNAALDAASGVSAAIDTDAAGLHVAAVQAGEEKAAQRRGSVTVRAPAGTPIASIDLFEGAMTLRNLRRGVRASLDHGSITAASLAGAIRLTTSIGDVHLERAELADEGMIHLRAFNGNVTLSFAAPPANARILALSLGGTIQSDIPLHLKNQFGPRFGEATIGRGAPVVSIDVVSGNIRIGGK